ncbi:MAG: exodeoxyribonuclease VII large subunit [bacterium]|nr:exodeoxyribonuclease VII large subunit [bacterium]
MNIILLQKLKEWRREAAQKEGVDLFRILSNSTIENIVGLMPKTKEELLSIKGIKEKKWQKYGKEILAITGGDAADLEPAGSMDDKSEKPLSVSEYLDLLNKKLGECFARIQGEISSFDPRDNVIYFSLKDLADGSLIRCLMWRRDYQLCGVDFVIGDEVILEGTPNVFKPNGGLSFKASSVELVGEGALKKAYDALKARLEKEGIFAVERKRPIPEYPQKIGLITSRDGAVINDFLTNIGNFGFHIKLIDSRVEGQRAVPELLKSIKYFRNKDIDVLIIIRGGGSLESLLPFNNEALIREVINFPKPVICGIGHDKDIPLVAMACDVAVSTPTAVTKILNNSWERALSKTKICERDIINKYQSLLRDKKDRIRESADIIERNFAGIFTSFSEVSSALKEGFLKIGFYIKNAGNALMRIEKILEANNPERQLKLGYSIARLNGRIVSSIEKLSVGETLEIQLSDGLIASKVNSLKKRLYNE